MGNGKQGKSWNYRSSLSRPGKCGSWEAMENRVICICKLRKQVKAAHNQETFPRKMAKFSRLWKNVEGHDRGPGKVMEFSKLYR